MRDMLEQLNPPLGLETAVVDAAGRPKIVYHGTCDVFKKFSPEKTDTDALYGPGFYFTEDPDIASEYAQRGTEEVLDGLGRAERRQIQESLEYQDLLRDKLETLMIHVPGSVLAFLKKHSRKNDAQSLAIVEAGYSALEFLAAKFFPAPCNVWPVYLQIANPFVDDYLDGTSSIVPDPAGLAAAEYILRAQHKWSKAEAYMARRSTVNFTSGYGYLSAAYFSGAKINNLLQQAGFDGITHIGGQIMGDKLHRVWIAFHPEQIIPAFVDA